MSSQSQDLERRSLDLSPRMRDRYSLMLALRSSRTLQATEAVFEGPAAVWALKHCLRVCCSVIGALERFGDRDSKGLGDAFEVVLTVPVAKENGPAW